MAKIFRLDCNGVTRAVGELWYDNSGNECFFRENGTVSCRTLNSGEIMTIQSEKDSCDINLIVAKYKKTGLMTNWRKDPPRYGDFSSSVDYHDSLLRAQNAQDDFMLLPASIRTRFNNDPGELIDFLSDSNNRAEAIELGLVASSQANKVPQGDVVKGVPPVVPLDVTGGTDTKV